MHPRFHITAVKSSLSLVQSDDIQTAAVFLGGPRVSHVSTFFPKRQSPFRSLFTLRITTCCTLKAFKLTSAVAAGLSSV